jgi:hypothetical protein
VADQTKASTNDSRTALPKGTLRVLIGVAALGYTGVTAIRQARRPTFLGIRLPRELTDVDPKNLDLRKLAKQVSKERA